MAEWEYMSISTIELSEMDKEWTWEQSLNKLGSDGWEAYTVIAGNWSVYYLKRQIG